MNGRSLSINGLVRAKERLIAALEVIELYPQYDCLFLKADIKKEIDDIDKKLGSL